MSAPTDSVRFDYKLLFSTQERIADCWFERDNNDVKYFVLRVVKFNLLSDGSATVKYMRFSPNVQQLICQQLIQCGDFTK